MLDCIRVQCAHCMAQPTVYHFPYQRLVQFAAMHRPAYAHTVRCVYVHGWMCDVCAFILTVRCC